MIEEGGKRNLKGETSLVELNNSDKLSLKGNETRVKTLLVKGTGAVHLRGLRITSLEKTSTGVLVLRDCTVTKLVVSGRGIYLENCQILEKMTAEETKVVSVEDTRMEGVISLNAKEISVRYSQILGEMVLHGEPMLCFLGNRIDRPINVSPLYSDSFLGNYNERGSIRL